MKKADQTKETDVVTGHGNGNGKIWLRIQAGHEKFLDRNFEAVEAEANTEPGSTRTHRENVKIP